MKELSKQELLSLMDRDVHDLIEKNIKKYQATHLVLFENQQMDSSAFGARTVMCVGKNNTYKTVEECEGKWLKDLPSQRQYAVSFCKT